MYHIFLTYSGIVNDQVIMEPVGMVKLEHLFHRGGIKEDISKPEIVNSLLRNEAFRKEAIKQLDRRPDIPPEEVARRTREYEAQERKKRQIARAKKLLAKSGYTVAPSVAESKEDGKTT